MFTKVDNRGRSETRVCDIQRKSLAACRKSELMANIIPLEYPPQHGYCTSDDDFVGQSFGEGTYPTVVVHDWRCRVLLYGWVLR
eukprot:scaffold25836_cov294-Cylindrotheca_fusiformis.AAC.1